MAHFKEIKGIKNLLKLKQIIFKIQSFSLGKTAYFMLKIDQ
jgi:hypothetical protein